MGTGPTAMLLTAALLACGCNGNAGDLPGDFVTYGFLANVEVATAAPQPGRRVDFVVGVTSTGNTPIRCDVLLDVVNDAGSEIYTQRWDDVMFQPDAQWNLTNGFLPATDVKGSYKLAVEVRRHDTGELMYANEASRLVFPTM